MVQFPQSAVRAVPIQMQAAAVHSPPKAATLHRAIPHAMLLPPAASGLQTSARAMRHMLGLSLFHPQEKTTDARLPHAPKHSFQFARNGRRCALGQCPLPGTPTYEPRNKAALPKGPVQ